MGAMVAWLAVAAWLLSVGATAYGVQFYYRTRLDAMNAELGRTRRRLQNTEKHCRILQHRQSARVEPRHAFERMPSAPTRSGL